MAKFPDIGQSVAVSGKSLGHYPFTSAMSGTRADKGKQRAMMAHITVDVVSDVAGLRQLGREWHELERLSPPSAVFQSHSLLALWADAFMQSAGGSRTLSIAAVREKGTLKLLLPVVLTGKTGMQVGHIAGTPIAQYSEILADPSGPIELYFQTALDGLRRAGADLLMFEGVRADSLLQRALGGRSDRPMNARLAPFANLSATPDHAALLRSRSKNLSKGLRNRRNQIDKIGDVRFEVIKGGPEAREAISTAIGLKREWLVEHGNVSRAFMDGTTTECLLDLAENCPEAVVLRMTLDGEQAAIRLGLEHRGAFFAYLSAYDTRLAQYSPGKLLMDFSFQAARERGAQVFDMLAPDGEHKRDWCSEAVPVADHAVPLTVKGRAYLTIIEQGLRPTLSWTWHHLPPRVRGVLAPLFLKV